MRFRRPYYLPENLRDEMFADWPLGWMEWAVITGIVGIMSIALVPSPYAPGQTRGESFAFLLYASILIACAVMALAKAGLTFVAYVRRRRGLQR